MQPTTRRLLLSIAALILLGFATQAQTKKTAAPAMPDVNKLMKMSPQELETYKQQMLKQSSVQAKTIAGRNNIKINEMLLPDYEIKPPVKDIQRLSKLPLQAPSRMELMASVAKSKKQLESVAPKELVQQVEKTVQEQNAAQLQTSAVASWYGDKPAEALLTAIGAVQKNPNEPIVWNNLAAFFNMSGLQDKAIPVLQHLLAQTPDNSMVLNNIGQAYLGLGDLSKAEQYLKQCLAIDEMNPEANRSMGMIRLYTKQVDEAQKYFEKELLLAHRRSTLANMKKAGRPINLYALRKQRKNVPHRDLFEEIELAKFTIPDLPATALEAGQWSKKHAGYIESLQKEFMFWFNSGNLTEEQQRAEGHKHPGLYSDLVNELLGELGDEYDQTLGVLREGDDAALIEMANVYGKNISQAVCPQAPFVPGGGADLQLAYQKKCCDIKTPIVDKYISEHNAFVQARIRLAQGRWKQYINGMIDIVQLDPSAGNKKMVYATVAGYFTFLLTSINLVATDAPPIECMVNLTTEEADNIIEASHNIDFNCPQWLNIEFSLGISKLKADCNKYSLEVGKGVFGGYEKDFKTGTSTLTAGVGYSETFGISGKLGAKQMVYISFDNNNEFADFGLKGKVEAGLQLTPQVIQEGILEVGGNIGSIEGGYTLGINSGFNGAVKTNGMIKEFINLNAKF